MTIEEGRLHAVADDRVAAAREAHDALETALFEVKRVIVGQSALLEVMQESQVTIGHESHPVPRPFLTMATQNPIESEGTYPLPEAQVDRFLFKLVVDYPSMGEEAAIVGRVIAPPAEVKQVLHVNELERFREH